MGRTVSLAARFAALPAKVPPVRRPAAVLRRSPGAMPLPRGRTFPQEDHRPGIGRTLSPLALYSRVGGLRRSRPGPRGRYVDFSV